MQHCWCLAVVVGLLISLAVAGTPPQARITDRTCDTTEDCQRHAQYQWCLSGQLCARHRCYTLADYPCRSGHFCNETARRCIAGAANRCTTHRECDDGLFCNGEERCVSGQCVRLPLPGGVRCPQCSEQNRSCVGGTPPTAPTTTTTEVGAKTTAPTAAPTSSGDWVIDRSGLLTALFIAACVVGGVALVFYIVTGAARPAVPTSVVIIAQNADGSDMDGGRARLLLSRDNYLQKIHYS